MKIKFKKEYFGVVAFLILMSLAFYSALEAIDDYRERNGYTLAKSLAKDYTRLKTPVELDGLDTISGNGIYIHGSYRGKDISVKCPSSVKLDDGKHDGYLLDPIVMYKKEWFVSKRSKPLSPKKEVIDHIRQCAKKLKHEMSIVRKDIEKETENSKSWETK